MIMETHCQIDECPYGKKPGERCRFNDAVVKDEGQEVTLRPKCKRDGNEYVFASTKPINNVA